MSRSADGREVSQSHVPKKATMVSGNQARDCPDLPTVETDQRTSNSRRLDVPASASAVHKRKAGLMERASKTPAFDVIEQDGVVFKRPLGVACRSKRTLQDPRRLSLNVQSSDTENCSLAASAKHGNLNHQAHSQPAAKPSVRNAAVPSPLSSIGQPIPVREKVSQWLTSSVCGQGTRSVSEDRGNLVNHVMNVLSVVACCMSISHCCYNLMME